MLENLLLCLEPQYTVHLNQALICFAYPDVLVCRAQVATLICHMLGASPEDSEAHTAALSRLDPAPLIAQMKHKTASHMVEAIFLSCPHKLYDAIFKAISNTFPALCVNPVANYAAQSLIAAAPAARNVGDIFHSLKGSLEDCLLRGRSGVACLLVAACSAWRIECEDCCKAVQDVFPDGVRFIFHDPCSCLHIILFVGFTES